jgi:DNA (cytosine-5)-methyltransferase 1
MIHHKLKVIDLCCGAGGFSEGFSQAGFDIILGVDYWGDALKSFQQNHHCEVLESDIRLVSDLPDCDVMIGSPPCQNLSKVSRNKNYELGLELIRVFEQLVRETKPDYWVWEGIRAIGQGNKTRLLGLGKCRSG